MKKKYHEAAADAARQTTSSRQMEKRGNLTPEMAQTSSYYYCQTFSLLVSIFILVPGVFKGNIPSRFTVKHRGKQTLIVNTCNDLPSTRRGR